MFVKLIGRDRSLDVIQISTSLTTNKEEYFLDIYYYLCFLWHEVFISFAFCQMETWFWVFRLSQFPNTSDIKVIINF